MLGMMIAVGFVVMLLGSVLFLGLAPAHVQESRPAPAQLSTTKPNFFFVDVETAAAGGTPEEPGTHTTSNDTIASVDDAVTMGLVMRVLEQYVRKEQAAVEGFLTRPSVENLQLSSVNDLLK